jgi:predicted DNA-binding protein
MKTQMIIRIDEDKKEKLSKIARAEGKNSNQVVRELIESYLQDRNIEGYIDDLWARIGSKLRKKKVDEQKIRKTIREIRNKKR